jgi:hypothetical protein
LEYNKIETNLIDFGLFLIPMGVEAGGRGCQVPGGEPPWRTMEDHSVMALEFPLQHWSIHAVPDVLPGTACNHSSHAYDRPMTCPDSNLQMGLGTVLGQQESAQHPQLERNAG